MDPEKQKKLGSPEEFLEDIQEPKNITSLKLASQRYNQQAIEYLTELLESAKQGRLTEFVMVYREDGEYAHAWTGCENLHDMISFFEILKFRQLMRIAGLK